MTTENKIGVATTAGVLMLFLISLGFTYTQALLGAMYGVFPDLPMSTVTYVNSISALFAVVGGLVVGFLSKRRIMGYKPMAILGSAIFLVSGVIPAFVHSFIVLLATRACLGFGVGMMMPIANTLVSAFYTGDKQTRMVSLGSAATQFGAMCMQMAAGFLADINFWLAFLAPALSVFSLIGAFLIVEPKMPEAALEEKETKDLPKEKIPGNVWYGASLMLIGALAMTPCLLSFSVFVAEYTDSLAMASAVQVTYSIGMILGGMAYEFVYKNFGKFAIPIAFALSGVGAFVVVTAGGLPLIFAGMFVLGFGFAFVIPAVLQIVGVTCSPTMVGFATTIVMSGMHVATFAMSPILGVIEVLIGDIVYAPIWIGIGVYVALTVLTIFVSPYPKSLRKGARSQGDLPIE